MVGFYYYYYSVFFSTVLFVRFSRFCFVGIFQKLFCCRFSFFFPTEYGRVFHTFIDRVANQL